MFQYKSVLILFSVIFLVQAGKLSLEKCGYLRHGSGLAVHPFGGKANAPPGTAIVLSSRLNEPRLRFCYDRSLSTSEEGNIRHVSGHCLVPASKTDATWNKMEIVLGPCGVSYSRWRFTGKGNIQHVSSGLCWHPIGGHGVIGDKVVLYNVCAREDRLNFWIHE
ncbi:hypothetical protein ACHWQZ_G014341 [Mnemiopsis leidyi]